MGEISSSFVIFLGIATTFFGLICIILLSKIMSFCCKIANKSESAAAKPSVAAQTSTPNTVSCANAQISNRGEFVAAISAAIAEELGTDVSSIRILSIKKI